MKIHLLKLTIIVSLGLFFAVYSLKGSGVRAFSSAPDPSLTGAPGEATCASCHFGGPTGGTLRIDLPATYSPNQEITLTVTLAQPDRQRYGFQLTAVDDSGRRAGDLTPNDGRTATQTGTVNSNQRQYINHTLNGITPSTPGQGSWTFRWKAPAQSVGRVTFYVSGNAANGNFTTTGDTIYTVNQSIQPGSTISNMASVSAASMMGNPLAANQVVAGFGTSLSVNNVEATTIPLPTQLDGTEISVKDANGMERLAGLFAVMPTQVNYLIPAGTANGTATITLRRNGVDTAQGTANIETIAPGVFAANMDGKGVAAALIYRVSGGAITIEPTAQRNSTTGSHEPREIDMGTETDLVFLVLFGTGLRGISAQTAATCTIGGTPATVAFIGAAPGFEGIEQMNIFLPRSLIGRKVVDVVLTADNKMANTVQISVK